MRSRLVLAPLLAAGLVLTMSSADAATKTLDGKKIKTLTLTASGGLQDHDDSLATDLPHVLDDSSPDSADCKAPRCAKLPFVYKPAKGVKGDVMFAITWSNPLSDYDLYVAEVDRDGTTTSVGKFHCGGTGGTSEKVFVPKGTFKIGKTYAMVVDFYRSVNDSVRGTVTMGPSTAKHPVPDDAEGLLFPINCTQ
jgi:hypothetical protein